MDVREVNLTLDFCTRVGELLIASGTGAADAVATMGMVSRALGLRNCDIDITFVTVAMQCQPSPDEPPISASRGEGFTRVFSAQQRSIGRSAELSE